MYSFSWKFLIWTKSKTQYRYSSEPQKLQSGNLKIMFMNMVDLFIGNVCCFLRALGLQGTIAFVDIENSVSLSGCFLKKLSLVLCSKQHLY